MSSKDIIRAYLDRDIYEAVGEKSLQKIVNIETRKSNLTDSQRQLLLALIHRRHDEKMLERVRKNIHNVAFACIVDSALGAENSSSDKESMVTDFISNLKSIDHTLNAEIKSLESKKSSCLKKTQNLTKKVASKKSENPILSVEDITDITEELHKYNASMTK